jgi:acyl phosphate:glycerol-3-phosphate acyltransferase
MLTWLALIAFAYLSGSLPFGYLLGRVRGIDIREHGSRNVGATNVGRVLGRKLGLLCFGLDAAKGAGPVILAGLVAQLWGVPAGLMSPQAAALWFGVAFAALVGHMASPWLGFRGGKGVATGFGALCAMWSIMTVPAIAAILVWIITLIATRYVSVSSIVAAASLPISAAIVNAIQSGWSPTHALIVTIGGALAALVIWKHRTNIGRLMRGEEPRVKSRRERRLAAQRG